MKTKILLLMMVLTLNACATAMASRMNHVSIGMSKDEVIDKVGEPNSTKGSDNGTEVLSYLLAPTATDAAANRYLEYWVILKNGKTVKYGRAIDFDSTDTHKVIIQHQ